MARSLCPNVSLLAAISASLVVMGSCSEEDSHVGFPSETRAIFAAEVVLDDGQPMLFADLSLPDLFTDPDQIFVWLREECFVELMPTRSLYRLNVRIYDQEEPREYGHTHVLDEPYSGELTEGGTLTLTNVELWNGESMDMTFHVQPSAIGIDGGFTLVREATRNAHGEILRLDLDASKLYE
jgi:hypothetical protein